MTGSTPQDTSIKVDPIARIPDPLDPAHQVPPDVARRELIDQLEMAGIRHEPHKVSETERRFINQYVPEPLVPQAIGLLAA